MEYNPLKNPIQAVVNEFGRQEQIKRSGTQMTLGKLITLLEEQPPERLVYGLAPGGPASYRGYYSDLAWEPMEGVRPASALLAEARAAMGKVYQGYKGGDYLMGETTPVWIAGWGNTGLKLVGFKQGSLGTLNNEKGVLTDLYPVTEEDE